MKKRKRVSIARYPRLLKFTGTILSFILLLLLLSIKRIIDLNLSISLKCMDLFYIS